MAMPTATTMVTPTGTISATALRTARASARPGPTVTTLATGPDSTVATPRATARDTRLGTKTDPTASSCGLQPYWTWIVSIAVTIACLTTSVSGWRTIT